MSDVRSILERGLGGNAPPPDGFERMLRRRDRKRRSQRIGAGVVGVLIVAAVIAAGLTAERRAPVPGRTPSPSTVTSPPAPPIPSDAFVDIGTGLVTPLPASIAGFDGGVGDYDVSPDGSMLLFDGRDDDGAFCLFLGRCDLTQIYVANIDGAGLRQVTSEPDGAVAGSWSPDGTMIAYITGWSKRPVASLHVLELASGATKQLASGLPQNVFRLPPPRFAPDGRTILFTGKDRALYVVPVEGGTATRVVDGGAWGEYSSDGSRLAYLTMTYECCAGYGRQEVFQGSDIMLAAADGTGARRLAGGTFVRVRWSPDGTMLVAERIYPGGVHHVVLIDASSGEVTEVIQAERPTWYDDDTLILE